VAQRSDWIAAVNLVGHFTSSLPKSGDQGVSFWRDFQDFESERSEAKLPRISIS
jgi:hypothetical protein